MTTVDELRQYCSTDFPRWTSRVHSVDEWLVATNGHSFVAKRGDGDCSAMDEYSADKVIRRLLEAATTHVCSLVRLREWTTPIPWDCKGCDGVGTVECACEFCDCEHDCICQECGGKSPTNPGRLCGLTVDRNRLALLLEAFAGRSVRLGVHDDAILVLEGCETRAGLMHFNTDAVPEDELTVRKAHNA